MNHGPKCQWDVSDLKTKRFLPTSLEGLKEEKKYNKKTKHPTPNITARYYCFGTGEMVPDVCEIMWDLLQCALFSLEESELLTLWRHFSLLCILTRHRGHPFTSPAALCISIFVICCVKNRTWCGLERRTLQCPWYILPINNVSPMPVSLIFFLFNYTVLVYWKENVNYSFYRFD